MTPNQKRVREISLASEWASYRELVLSADAGGVQVVETQRAFYSGALAIVSLFHTIGEDDVPEEDGVAALERLHGEAVTYGEAQIIRDRT